MAAALKDGGRARRYRMFDQQTLQALAWAALGCGFTWLMTTAGSAVVLFTSNDPEKGRLTHHIFLGFAAGVMIAAGTRTE